MDKNWLIRTKSNHILGPVSKEKVIELYHNGSIKPDDEICSGNGYWFFLREEDLVQRFLLGNEVQGFNPISEAKDVLTTEQSASSEDTSSDITKVGGINISLLNEQFPKTSSSQLKTSASSETKKKSDAESSGPIVKAELKVAPPLPVKTSSSTSPSVSNRPMKTPAPQVPMKKQGWLRYAGLVGFIVLFLLLYFRKSIIHYMFQVETPSFISAAYAQEEFPEKKKSSLMNR